MTTERLSITNLHVREFMETLEDGSVQLIVTDPPFGTGVAQHLKSSGRSYSDPDVAEAVELIKPIFEHANRVLTRTGLIAMLLDHRAVHETAVMSRAFVRQHGEIIWKFNTGGVSKSWWSNKHNTILLLSPRKNPAFNYDEVPTVERLAPVKGYTHPKKVSSVWEITMSTSDGQRVGYPSQKPLEVYERLIKVHTNEHYFGNSDDLVVDPFAGSGTVLEAAHRTGRRAMANDISVESFMVMVERRAKLKPLPELK